MAIEKHFVNFTASSSYMDTVNYLLEHIEDKDHNRNPNKFSFLLASSATLECVLNESIIWWANRKFSQESYKRMAQAFLSMSLKSKLDGIVYLLSDGVFLTNNQSKTYQVLSNLITHRNKVAHPKDFFSEIEFDMNYGDDGIISFATPDLLKEKANDTPLAISTKECREIKEALTLLIQLINPEGSLNFQGSKLCSKVA